MARPLPLRPILHLPLPLRARALLLPLPEEGCGPGSGRPTSTSRNSTGWDGPIEPLRSTCTSTVTPKAEYAAQDQFVEPAYRGPRPSTAEPYRAYLQHRWAEGETNRRQLWNELQAQGFTGSYISVWKLTRTWVPPPTPQVASPPPEIPARPAARTVRQVAWLLQEPSPQKSRDLAYREALYQACPDLALAAQLVQSFGSLLRERQPEALDGWLEQAEKSGLRELRRFALGVRQDYAAVRAALEEPWSHERVAYCT